MIISRLLNFIFIVCLVVVLCLWHDQGIKLNNYTFVLDRYHEQAKLILDDPDCDKVISKSKSPTEFETYKYNCKSAQFLIANLASSYYKSEEAPKS